MISRKSFIPALFVLGMISSAHAAQTIKTHSYTLAIAGGLYDEKLTLNGKIVYDNPEMQGLSLEASFLNTPQESDIYLLQTTTGGNACPAYYRFVTIEKSGKAVLSDSFGTCSDLYEVSYTSKELRVSIPRMQESGTATYLYVKGKVKELGR